MKKFAKLSILMLLTVVVGIMLSACGLFGIGSENQGTSDDDGTSQDPPPVSVPSDEPDDKEFNALKVKLVGTWEYECNEESIIEFGRPETMYGMSGVNQALNDYMESIGFTMVGNSSYARDGYYVDRLTIRHGIIGQKFIFGADNSLRFSLLFQTDFQVIPAQLGHFDDNLNFVLGDEGDAVNIPDEMPPRTVPYGYYLVNSKDDGIRLQNVSDWDIDIRNMRLVNDNTLEMHYFRLGKANAEILTFARTV